MNRKREYTETLMAQPARVLLGAALVVALIGLGAGVSAVALQGHSREVAEYGTGAARWVTAGKVFGLLAGTMVLVQFVLSAKLKWLDRIFGLHAVLRLHRLLGPLAATLAFIHPFLVFSPGAEKIGPLRFAIWPELVGAALLISLWTAVCTALYREFLRLPYHQWYRFHQLGMFGAAVLLMLHVTTVTDDFGAGWPLAGLAAAGLGYGAVFAWKKLIHPAVRARGQYAVTQVAAAGRNTYAVTLAPPGKQAFGYAPGQFAFVTFHTPALPRERHHWTLSSTPTRPRNIVFTIKCSGDFTSRIGRLKPGDTASVDGPYGRFTHLAGDGDPGREIVMVAGGIGVTPMLSMLRFMADRDGERTVCLIWSNRTEQDIICRDEVEGFQSQLPHFTLHHVMTRQEDFTGLTGHLGEEMLGTLLKDRSREAAVFICGPPPLMVQVYRDLKTLGFRSRNIRTEQFSY